MATVKKEISKLIEKSTRERKIKHKPKLANINKKHLLGVTGTPPERTSFYMFDLPMTPNASATVEVEPCRQKET